MTEKKWLWLDFTIIICKTCRNNNKLSLALFQLRRNIETESSIILIYNKFEPWPGHHLHLTCYNLDMWSFIKKPFSSWYKPEKSEWEIDFWKLTKKSNVQKNVCKTLDTLSTRENVEEVTDMINGNEDEWHNPLYFVYISIFTSHLVVIWVETELNGAFSIVACFQRLNSSQKQEVSNREVFSAIPFQLS